MSATVILFPRSREPVAKSVWKWTSRGYCLTNVVGSKFVHIRPQVPVLRDVVYRAGRSPAFDELA